MPDTDTAPQSDTDATPDTPDAPTPPPNNANTEGYWRRKAAEARQQLEAANADKAALLTEAQKAAELEADLLTARADAARVRVAAQHNIPLDALEFIPGADEATILAGYTKLAGAFSAQATAGATAARPPVTAGTVTQPAAQQQATTEEQIGAAMARGDDIAAIRLMRQKQFNT